MPQRLATQQPAEEDAGSGPARPGARQPRGQAAWPGRHVAAPAWPGRSKGPESRRPGLLGDRGHIVPTPGSTEEQAVASTLAASLKGGQGPPPQLLRHRAVQWTT